MPVKIKGNTEEEKGNTEEEKVAQSSIWSILKL